MKTRKETKDEDKEDEEKNGYILWLLLAVDFLNSLMVLIQNKQKDILVIF